MSAVAGWLREILRCPACHGELTDVPGHLTCVNVECGLSYPISNGIPVLLVSDAVPPAAGPDDGAGKD